MLPLIHPALVHFSVSFLLAGAACEGWGFLTGREPLRRFGSNLVAAGTAFLVPTVIAGFLASNAVAVPGGAERILELHERVGLAILAVFLASQFWKVWVGGSLSGGRLRVYLVLLGAGFALTVWGAFLGGDLVYRHGVGVGTG